MDIRKEWFGLKVLFDFLITPTSVAMFTFLGGVGGRYNYFNMYFIHKTLYPRKVLHSINKSMNVYMVVWIYKYEHACVAHRDGDSAAPNDDCKNVCQMHSIVFYCYAANKQFCWRWVASCNNNYTLKITHTHSVHIEYVNTNYVFVCLLHYLYYKGSVGGLLH